MNGCAADEIEIAISQIARMLKLNGLRDNSVLDECLYIRILHKS